MGTLFSSLPHFFLGKRGKDKCFRQEKLNWVELKDPETLTRRSDCLTSERQNIDR